MPDLITHSDDSLPALFIERARAAMLDGHRKIEFDPWHVVAIASATNLRTAFIDLVNNQSNDPDLKRLVLEYIRDIAEALENSTAGSESFIDLIDKAGFPVATGAVGAGIALLVSAGIILGPIALFSGGLVGLGLCGTGRTIIRLQGNKNKFAVIKLKRLNDDLVRAK